MSWQLSDKVGYCFICGQPTKRLDIHLGEYFCGSDSCEALITAALQRLTFISALPQEETQKEVESG